MRRSGRLRGPGARNGERDVGRRGITAIGGIPSAAWRKLWRGLSWDARARAALHLDRSGAAARCIAAAASASRPCRAADRRVRVPARDHSSRGATARTGPARLPRACGARALPPRTSARVHHRFRGSRDLRRGRRGNGGRQRGGRVPAPRDQNLEVSATAGRRLDSRQLSPALSSRLHGRQYPRMR